jgi:HPt (histidine-containing phosphotransfer) domain-containing protein
MGLCHLAHSLKTVLRTLGRADLSDLAFAIEQQAPLNMDEARTQWQALRLGLLSGLD